MLGEWVQTKMATDPDFHKNFFFRDEVFVWLNGYFAFGLMIVHNPNLRHRYVTVWCSLWAEGIIGPYFLKNETGNNVTISGECCRATINDIFVPEFCSNKMALNATQLTKQSNY